MYRVESYESSVSLDSTELSAIEDHKAEFEAANSIEELQRLTIGFLQGEKSATAYHFGPIMAESSPIIDKLVALNQLGFLTTNSQPGGTEIFRGQKIQKRFFVEGILSRQFLSIFMQQLYTRMGEKCFITCLDSEMSYEEIQNLKKNDLYWVSRDEKAMRITKEPQRIGLLHISEFIEPCQSFQTCVNMYSEIKDNYVSVFVMDTRWGYAGTELLDAMYSVIQKIHGACWGNGIV